MGSLHHVVSILQLHFVIAISFFFFPLSLSLSLSHKVQNTYLSHSLGSAVPGWEQLSLFAINEFLQCQIIFIEKPLFFTWSSFKAQDRGKLAFSTLTWQQCTFYPPCTICGQNNGKNHSICRKVTF